MTATVETAAALRVTPITSRRERSDGLVSRPILVRRLAAARGVPVVLLVAPAGYGKTVLLSEWARVDDRDFSWVSLRPADDDPDHLRTTLAILEPARGSVLVLDGLHAIHSRDSLALISDLIERAEEGSQLVLASRTEPALRLAGLRAERKLMELRSPDLAMSMSEAAALLGLHGFVLDRDELETLVRRTEGWPAALYLATLAAHEERHPARAIAGFAGDDRLVADYVDDEVLAALDRQQVAFLARASVLDSLSGPVCDFVLDRKDSARQLKRLSRSSLMLVPLDRSDDEYRYHRLFGQTLRAELRRSEPEAEQALHERASDWYGSRGDIDRALAHALAAGDVARAGELIWSRASTLIGFGQLGQLRRWLAAFSDDQISASAPLALAAAAANVVAGDRNLVDHWTSAALRAGAGDREVEAIANLLSATVAEDSVETMGDEAGDALATLPEDSPWLGLACLLQGVASHLAADRERARGLLEDGARRSAAGSPSIQALCLAQLGLLAVERRDWAAAESLSARAKAQVERSGTGDYPTSALVYALSAEVDAHLGRVEVSRGAADHASRLLDELVDFSPWYEAECRIALARAALRLTDARRARELLSMASHQLERSPDAKSAREWLDDCRAEAEQTSEDSASRDWALTTAELRVLQFLPTHLSFPDIADRLYVSANTVKTHARSVYRKLDATSRGEAVARAREAGLLNHASHASAGPSGFATVS
jgi:LuxR family transcriptional regulator, maltose regulon positive regulatory protein